MLQLLRTLATLALIASLLWPSVSVRAASVDDVIAAAVGYLRGHAAHEPEWAALAVRAAGQSADDIPVGASTEGTATDLARRILALTAVGADPRPLADALEGKMVNGSVNGDSYLNDDTFALMALYAAGWLATDEPLPTIATYLKSYQRTDGGWGVTTLSKSDVDSTAAALQAVWVLGERGERIQRGLDYVRSQQNADAGFPFRKPSASNSASTAWALSTLSVLGQSLDDWHVGSLSPTETLIGYQQADGGFGYQASDATSTTLLTSYATLALSRRGFVVRVFVPPPPNEPEPPSLPPPPPAPPDPAAERPAFPQPPPAVPESVPNPSPSAAVQPKPDHSSAGPGPVPLAAVQTIIPPTESRSAGGRPGRCRIKGDVIRRGHRVLRRYYPASMRAYRWIRIKPRQGDRWFCSSSQARRAGFRLASRR